MKDDEQLGNHDGDPAGGLDDDELRALFGADIRGDLQDEDISENDQRFLRGLFAADVATPPPSRMTVASILEAARNGDQPAVEHDPDTDRFRPVVGLPTPADSAGPSGASGQSGPPGFADRTRHRSAPAGASPVWSGDEVGARRRRRNIRNGLLTAAAVAAVVAIGVPIALNSGNTSPTGANSAAMAATSAAASRGGPAAQEAHPQSGAAGNSDSGVDSSAAEPPAASSGTAGSATNGDLPQGPGPSGQPPMSAAPPAPSKGGVTSQRTGSQTPDEESAAASGSGNASAGGGTESSRVSGSSSASDTGELSKATCGWPELPAAVDQSATTVFGAGVVGGHRALTSSCLPSRVAGAVFPAANGSRGAVTVEVVSAVQVGSCSTDACRQVGNGIYVGQDRDTTFVWLYQGGQQIKVGASTGLNLGQASLISFAKAVGSIVR